MKRIWVLMLLVLVFLTGACIAKADYSMPVADDNLDPVQGLDENWLNVLLIGTDNRERDLEGGRSDTMIICSLNKQTGQLRFVSLARDLWVTMGDNGHKNKLNAAHSFGGPNLLMQTVNRTFDMNIEHYVTVNFYGICEIVDTLGGVTLEMTAEEVGTVNRTASDEYTDTEIVSLESGAGMRTLCGAQALAYARIRKLDSDIGRQNRQRNLLLAMVERITDCSITGIADVISTCLKYVKTNLTFMELVPLAIGVIDHGVPEVTTRGIPREGEYTYDGSDGVSKLLVDYEEMKRVLFETIYQ